MVQKSIQKLNSENADAFATKAAVSSVAKVAASNTKTVQEVKEKFGGFDLSDFNKRINELGYQIKQGAEDMKAHIRENFQEDLKGAKFDIKQLGELVDEQFKTIKIDEIDANLALAKSSRDEVYVLLEEVKKGQAELFTKMQGVGSTNEKLETSMGKKLGSLEDEMYKLQGEYVKMQELASQAENFNIWHESVGKELENTADGLIKTEQELLEKFTKMLSEITVLKPLASDLETLRVVAKKQTENQNELFRKLASDLAVSKQTIQIQAGEIVQLRDDVEILRMGGVIKDAPEEVESKNSPDSEEPAVDTEIPAVENAKDEL